MTATSGVDLGWSYAVLDCEHEDISGSVEIWEDLEDGKWGFTCVCGREVVNLISDRGATQVAALVFSAGFFTVLVALAFMFVTPITGTHIGAVLAGALIMAAVLITDALNRLNRRTS